MSKPATFALGDLRKALSAHKEALAKYGDSTALEQVARTRRWLDEGDQHAAFAEAADDLEQGFTHGDTASPDLWATVGGYRHLAGEHEQARRALGKAIAGGTEWEPSPQGPAGVYYLLGDFDRAVRLAPVDPEGWIAAGARDRDTEPVQRARQRWIDWQRLDTSGPQHDRDPIPLSTWDWIEETYRLESEIRGEPAPSHLEMLRRSGLLGEGDEPTELPAPRRPPRPGFVASLGQHGETSPRLEVVNDDLVTVALAPKSVLDFGRYKVDEGWGVRLSDGMSSGEWILAPGVPDFQDAAYWAADWLKLRGQPDDAEAVRHLVAAHDC